VVSTTAAAAAAGIPRAVGTAGAGSGADEEPRARRAFDMTRIQTKHSIQTIDVSTAGVASVASVDWRLNVSVEQDMDNETMMRTLSRLAREQTKQRLEQSIRQQQQQQLLLAQVQQRQLMLQQQQQHPLQSPPGMLPGVVLKTLWDSSGAGGVATPNVSRVQVDAFPATLVGGAGAAALLGASGSGSGSGMDTPRLHGSAVRDYGTATSASPISVTPWPDEDDRDVVLRDAEGPAEAAPNAAPGPQEPPAPSRGNLAGLRVWVPDLPGLASPAVSPVAHSPSRPTSPNAAAAGVQEPATRRVLMPELSRHKAVGECARIGCYEISIARTFSLHATRAESLLQQQQQQQTEKLLAPPPWSGSRRQTSPTAGAGAPGVAQDDSDADAVLLATGVSFAGDAPRDASDQHHNADDGGDCGPRDEDKSVVLPFDLRLPEVAHIRRLGTLDEVCEVEILVKRHDLDDAVIHGDADATAALLDMSLDDLVDLIDEGLQINAYLSCWIHRYIKTMQHCNCGLLQTSGHHGGVPTTTVAA
jgi:hypothetical protein